MQYWSLQHHTLLPSLVTFTTGCCFHLGSISSFFVELFLHSSPVAYWPPADLESSSFSVPSFCLFILFMGFSRQTHSSNNTFQRHKRRLYTWTSPDGQHRNQIDYILCSQRWRSSIQSTKTRPGADCGSDHELLIAKFRLKLKKVGKTTRPFRYELNQILMIIQWK